MPNTAIVSPPDCLTLRDPAGELWNIDGRLIRIVKPQFTQSTRKSLGVPAVDRLMADGALVRTWELSPIEARGLIPRLPNSWPGEPLLLEHERIPFISYPEEWPREMLAAGAEHTIEIARQLMGNGLGLKDATPRNLLFTGHRPVLVDFLSIEPRAPLDPIWAAAAQFQRMFLHPLLARKYLAQPVPSLFLGRRDGWDIEELYERASLWQRFLPSLFLQITLPTWLSRLPAANSKSLYRPRSVESPEKAAFLLRQLFDYFGRSISRSKRGGKKYRPWTQYYASCPTYSCEDATAKRKTVEGWLETIRPKNVLDIGANTGDFSRMAAKKGARVVAIDSDESVTGIGWREASAQKLDVLSLVVAFDCPTPSTGWRNKESLSFLERARGGQFDLVMMLAVLHHLRVSGGIPLAELLASARELTTRHLLVELVTEEDPAVQHLARGRAFPDLRKDYFERELRGRFRCEESVRLGRSHRWLYLLRREDAGA